MAQAAAISVLLSKQTKAYLDRSLAVFLGTALIAIGAVILWQHVGGA